jgi:WD40 repeat protein
MSLRTIIPLYFVALFGIISLPAQATTVFVDGTGADGNNYLFTYSGGTLVNQSGPATMGTPGQIAIGPNGNLYIPDQDPFNGPGIDEFNGQTGQYMGQYLASSFSNGLTAPVGAVWGPDGKLYIADQGSGGQSYIDSFDGSTLTPVIAVPNALDDPVGMTFGPDGKLYIADGQSVVYQWDGSNLTQFTPTGVEGGGAISGLAFGPDGNLYVTGVINGDVLEFNGSTGAFIGDYGNTSSVLVQPIDLTFASDGSLYVTDGLGVEVFDSSGDFVSQLVQADSDPGDLSNPMFLAFATPEPSASLMVAAGLFALLLFRRKLSGAILR